MLARWTERPDEWFQADTGHRYGFAKFKATLAVALRSISDTVITQLIRIFLDISVLRRGPQDLPASTPLTVITLTISVLTGLALAKVVGEYHAVSWTLVATAIATIFTLTILAVRGVSHRWRQTVTAFSGTGTILTLVFLPVAGSLQQTSATSQSGNELIYLIGLALFAWSFVLDAHIFRHALSLSFSAGFLVASLAFALLSLCKSIWFLDPT